MGCTIKNIFYFFLLFFGICNGQNYINTVNEDVTKLATAYLNPILTLNGLSLGRNWQTNAKTLEPLSVDLKVQVLTSFIPSSYQSFNVNDLGLKTIRPIDDKNVICPTILGGKAITSSAYLGLYSESRDVTQTLVSGQVITTHVTPILISESIFKFPSLADFSPIKNTLMLPFIQMNVGAAWGAELSFRYSYFSKSTDAFNLVGIGYKQSINQLLYGEDGNDSFLDVSFFCGYSSLNFNNTSTLNLNLFQEVVDQKIQLKTYTLNSEILVSKEFDLFDLFVGSGFARTGSKLSFLGKYSLVVPEGYKNYFKNSNYDYTTYPEGVTINNPLVVNSNKQNFYLTIGAQFYYGSYLKSSISYARDSVFQSLNLSIAFSFERFF